MLALNDYKGGPIRISDPTGVGTAKQVYALVSISGTNTVTAQSGAGITAEGYAALSMERYSRTASLTVSGQPAVQTDRSSAAASPSTAEPPRHMRLRTASSITTDAARQTKRKQATS